jgi:hypothetical protein
LLFEQKVAKIGEQKRVKEESLIFGCPLNKEVVIQIFKSGVPDMPTFPLKFTNFKNFFQNLA